MTDLRHILETDLAVTTLNSSPPHTVVGDMLTKGNVLTVKLISKSDIWQITVTY